MSFRDKVYIVTGSSQGIGLELGRQLHGKGAGVVFNGRRKAAALSGKVLPLSHNRCLYVPADVSSFTECEALVNKTVEKFGRIDGLILNAGISAYGEFSELSEEVVRQMVEVNMLGITWITQLAIPYLRASKGCILFISSIASLHGVPRYSYYSAVKAAMNALAESLRIEMKKDGVYVGTALVGFTENEEQKKTLNSRGELEPVPSRSGFRPMPRVQLAEKLLDQLDRQRTIRVYSFMGKLGYFLSRISPKVYELLLKRNYR